MDIFSLIFYGGICFGIAAPVLSVASTILVRLAKVREHQRKQDAALLAAQIKLQDAARRAQLHDAKLIVEINKLDVQNAALEEKLLKIRGLKYKQKLQGLDRPDFNAQGYDDTTTPK